MQWRKLARLKSSPGGQSRARRMLCCGRRKENGRAAPDLTASPGRAPPGPPQPPRANHAPPCVLQPDFRKVSGVSNEIFRQIEMVENDHDATTAAALEAVERRGEMIVRILELRQVGRNNIEAAKKFFSLQDSRHIVQLVEIVKRPGQTLGLYIREGDGGTRTDGVFISRIALESAVYNSGCLKVGDEILAVNLVDVRRMSLDDVVIIMSIPRRLLLCTRQRKGKSGPGSPSLPRSEHKPPPVVVLKRDCRDDDDRDRDRVDGLYSQHGTLRSTGGPGSSVRPVGDGREERSRLQLGALSPDSTALDLYYNPRPPSDHSTWSYRPPPPVITEQPKSSTTHFVPYERTYPNTLESLAEKVHSLYPGDTGSSRFGGRVPRSGSEQQLPRAETHSDFGRHSLLRSSLKASAAGPGASSLRYNQRYGGVGMTGPGLSSGLTSSALSSGLGPGLPSGLSTTGLSGLTGSSLVGSGLTSSGIGAGLSGTGLGSTLGGGYGTTGLGLSSYSSKFGTSRRNRSLDYSSDTEATAPTRTPYYSGLSGYRSSTLGRDIGSKFNSLPRDVRGTGQRLGLSRRAGSVLQDEPEPLSSRLDLRSSRGRLPSSPSVFTSDEYRAWLSRAPSTSALYETLRPRLPTHYSAENIHDALKNMESGSRFGSSLGLAGRRMERPRHLPARSLSSQQLGPTAGGSPSARRVRQLLELGSRFNCPNPSPVPTPGSRHHRHLDINPNDFLKYKVENKGSGCLSASMTGLSRLSGGVSGMLWVHLLAGRGLRPAASGSSPGSPPSGPLAPAQPPVAPRDLYCVLECDRVHKARTVVRNGELQFDWDESFELELVDNRQLDVLVYSWDPQHRHKLCYRGMVILPDMLVRSPSHQLAIKMEPRGTLYVRFRHTEPHDLFKRRPAQSRLSPPPLFGAELEAVIAREVRPPHAPPVPLIVRRCVEEIERRGLDIIGLYRLCGSASKKRILREAFERNPRGVELNPDSVPDINVITGLLKDYLRELPQPLFNHCLFQMTAEALSSCLPNDREGNARLVASIVECLPRAARATLVFLLDHLALVVAAQDRNKMSPQHLAVALAPPLILHCQSPNEPIDYQRPISFLQSLLQIWPAPKRSVRRGEPALGPRGSKVSASPAASLILPQGRVPPSASPYRHQAAASVASQQPALSARHAPDRSPPAHVLSSVRAGQYRPQSPLRGPLPAPPRSRQVTVSSPGSPSSSSGSHSPADTIKHGGSVSSILRQPERASSPRMSPRNSPRASPRDSPRTSTPRENSSREMTPRDLTPREMTPRDLTPRESSGRDGSRDSPRSAIPGTSAGLAVTLNASGALSPRYSSTNPFLQQYDAEEEAEAWRAADIFSSSTHT
ncbi:rho GTPase-activating protein 100F isoform X1 [Plodia interpunctella]|uniref:rho GTPase-activating protein 100F isoform X1 n=1 Tax=Plodia interpunctella TaxID=58824 RepID=UPI0023677631|nr:rho GTPase-activating protein 100F isoform X1 [Plodia interpunctella]